MLNPSRVPATAVEESREETVKARMQRAGAGSDISVTELRDSREDLWGAGSHRQPAILGM